MIRKLRSKAAMTLTELLVAMAIMALVFTAAAAGISVAFSTLRTMSLSSESSILCDTLANAIADELRYATEVKADVGGVAFNSKTFGEGVTISANDAGRIVVSGANTNQLLGEMTYSIGLLAGVDVTYDETNGVFAVSVWAYTSDSPDSTWGATTTNVRALNFIVDET